ncbi:MAG TPA: ORF6N domain-containing protein [Nitrospirota bacterium]|nr:ORF6N domain-containing protein [Nitrospirota bacterium]
MKAVIPMEAIEQKIMFIRGKKVMLDRDLAVLYAVETFNLNKAVKRNIDRFPSDFMFQITKDEVECLIFQFGISKTSGRGGRRYLPYAFTEQGIAMLSTVLKSKRAVQVNIAIMRAFVKLREMIASHKDLAKKLEELEKKYDAQFRVVFDAIRELMIPPEEDKRKIGFMAKETQGLYKSGVGKVCRSSRVSRCGTKSDTMQG